jgi:cytochrome c oxidase assembly protein Cox11
MLRLSQDPNKKNIQLSLLVLSVSLMTLMIPFIYGPIYYKLCGALGIQTTSSKPVDALLQTAREGIGQSRANESTSLVNFMGVSGQLPIDIRPLKRRDWIKTGELYMVTYRLSNLTDQNLDFKAMHMLLPQGDTSFELVKCFCNEHRVIKAHEVQDLPLTFRLRHKVPGDAGLTVNYTIFDYKPGQLKKVKTTT